MTLQFPLSSLEIANARLWNSDVAAFQSQPIPQNAVLFTGSSSIRAWETLEADFPGVPTVNRGFGGSQLSDSVYHFGAIFLPVAPRAVVFYAGDNDLGFGKKVGRLVKDFYALAELIQSHLPGVPLFFISIKPSPARWHLIEKIRESNSIIQEFCRDEPQLRFVDMDASMLDEAGLPRADLYVEDELHMSPSGYAAWTRVLQPLLEPFKDDKVATALDN